MITMTIEVSPKQAIEIAKILGAENAPTPAPAAPIIPVQQVPTAPPVTVAQTPVAVPVQAAAPVQTPTPVIPVQPTAAPAPTVPAPVAPAAPIPTVAKEYTMDELSLASRPIVEANRQQELLDLLHSFTFTDANGVVKNVQSIRDLPKELYPAFANGIRQLGGRI